VLHSDVVRKQRAGLQPDERPSPELASQLYEPAAVAATYDDMLATARVLLEQGHSVIVDASWTSDVERQRARALASDAGATAVELHCVCDPAVARQRIERRLVDSPSGAAGASDATAEVADTLEGRRDRWPEAIVVDTSGSEAASLAEALAATGPW